MLSAVLGLVGIALAIAIPLTIEALRRPRLAVEPTSENPDWHDLLERPSRMLRIRVRNRPWAERVGLGTVLLGETASSCTVRIQFGDAFEMHARWDDGPQPTDERTWAQVEPVTRRRDVPPGDDLAILSVVFMLRGANDMWAFSGWSYLAKPPLCPQYRWPDYRLTGRDYRVSVTAQSGPVRAERVFRLRNPTSDLRRFRLEPMAAPPKPVRLATTLIQRTTDYQPRGWRALAQRRVT